MTPLDTLLGTYFDAGHAEGKEGRTHDTVDGVAQRTLSEIHDCIKAMVAAETEACAKLMELKRDDLRLMGGEMSAEEILTVQAVLTNRAAVIRRRLPEAAAQYAAPTI
jgi:hypothetical protein